VGKVGSSTSRMSAATEQIVSPKQNEGRVTPGFPEPGQRVHSIP
jgi:hypothetical protein